MNFFEEVYRLTRQIPKGKVSTYGAIAKALGDVRASRAVGLALNLNPDPEFTPCYKVVMSDGALGGFGRGIEDKIRRLKKDGVMVKNGRIVDFEKHFFDDFKTVYPLRELRREQLELSKRVITRDFFDSIKSVAGVDLAYRKTNNRLLACAAYVTIDFEEKKTIEKGWIYDDVKIPYIPTYLAYTELPLVEKLWNMMEIKPSVMMLDGNGVLHPHGIGLASHVGVELNTPTVGVAKSHLYGVIKERKGDGCYIEDEDGERIGYAFFSSKSIKKPVYVSPGHKVSLDTAVKIVKHLSVYRVPEPTRQAHILAKSKIIEREV
ncbi:MAG TPA: methylated-DNA--[protein]-cysteine S-methyltransferase [Thermoplasmatales archaeon]|nr:methylated-DNA--[protein]-cysteine S-methyltransferase [Thermoplasmatales archaeon]